MNKVDETENESLDLIVGKSLVPLGCALSAIWIALISFMAFCQKGSTFLSLTLNEQGDFLAGAFAPLAFGWLVLGFFQQGRELKLQARELNQQTKELRNTVEQHKEMVDVSERTLEYSRLRDNEADRKRKEIAQPKLQVVKMDSVFHGVKQRGESQLGNVKFVVSNSGASIGGVSIDLALCEIDGVKDDLTKFDKDSSRIASWETGDREITVSLPRDSYPKLVELYFLIGYVDGEGVSQRIGAVVKIKNGEIIENPQSVRPIETN